MNLKIIKQTLLPLILATFFIIIFNWQFPYCYDYIIQHFTSEKLSVLYAHLFVYTFGIFILFISWINLFNYFIFKSKIFVLVSLLGVLLFYILSSAIIVDIFEYFIEYPLSTNAIMGMVLFSIGTLSYALYSIGFLVSQHHIPLSHIVTFTLLGTLYALGFIDVYCYPISEILTKL